MKVVGRVTSLTLGHPRASAVALTLFTLLFAAGIPRVTTELGYAPLLGASHPSIRTLEGFIDRFGGGLPVMIVWECGEGRPCQRALDPDSLSMASELEAELGSLRLVNRVVGPASFPLLVPTPDGFEIHRFGHGPRNGVDHSRLASQAIADPLWVGHVVSADGTTGAIHVLVSDSTSETSLEVVDGIQRALRPFEAEGYEFHLVGHAVAFAVAGRELTRSTAMLVPFTALVMGLILLFCTRSWRATLFALSTMGIALLWTYGLVGWLELPNDNVLQVLAPLILVVGICDAIHLLSAYAEAAPQGSKPWDAGMGRSHALRAAEEVAAPCWATTLTTALAFASFSSSDLGTFVRFGMISAFGVTSCFLLTFTLLPLLLAQSPAHGTSVHRTSDAWKKAMESLVRVSEVRSRSIVVLTVAFGVVFGFGWAAYLRVDTSWYELFGEHTNVVRWIRFVEQRMGRLENLEIQVALPDGGSAGQRQVLGALEPLTRGLAHVEGLGRARSVLDVTDRVHRMLEGVPEGNGPEAIDSASRAEVLELLSLYDLDLIRDWITLDRRLLRISVDAASPSTATRRSILERVDATLSQALPDDWSVTLTGPFAIGFEFVDALQKTQLRSFPTAAILVFVVLIFLLGSIRLSVAAMIPTLLPVVVTLGAMGWAGMSLDIGRAMIGAVLIGIGVDDSVHLLSRYRTARSRGLDPRAAMRGSVLTVGRPVVTTSLALALGALTFLASSWQTVSSFGFYMALSILGALAADLFVLPSLVFACTRTVHAPQDGSTDAARADPPLFRRTTVFLIALPVAGALVMAGASTLTADGTKALDCWILPNGRIAPLPDLEGRCPLLPNEQVHSVRLPGDLPTPWIGSPDLESQAGEGEGFDVSVTRNGEETWVHVGVRELPFRARALQVASAGLIALVLLCIPILLVWRSTSAAALPFAVLYSCLATIGVTTIAGRPSESFGVLTLISLALIPGALVHLALTFPRERAVLEDVPVLRWLPYTLTGVLIPGAWLALERDALLWPFLLDVIGAFVAGAWVILLASCYFALRESSVPLERARSRIVLWGALLVPLVPTAFFSRVASDSEDIFVLYLAACVLAMPVPIGVAISRYNLFDLENSVRIWIARFVYVTAVASVLALLLSSLSVLFGREDLRAPPDVWFTTSFVAVAVLEPIRRRTFILAEGMLFPRIQNLRVARERYAREVRELRAPDDVARHLGATLRSTLESSAGCVFVSSGRVWLPVHAFGEEPPLTPSLARSAAGLLDDRSVLQVSGSSSAANPAEEALRQAGAEIAARVELDGRAQCVVLLGESSGGLPYTRLDLDFVHACVEQAGLALHNALLAEDLIVADRHITTGRLALALAHDVGKEMDWLRRLVQRLPSRLDDASRLKRDVSTISQLSEELSSTIRSFIRQAREPHPDSPEILDLDHMLERAVRAVIRIRPGILVTRSVDPTIRGLRLDRAVERVIYNLLDNAAAATTDATPVRVSASSERTGIRVAVRDHGSGMSHAVRAQAFDMGFTTRAARGGMGVGLTVSREIVRSLGGTLELHPQGDGGTLAEVHLPTGSRA